MGEAYRLNEPQVACEVLEGDLILLNFESGFYYNIRGIGADICQFLLAGGSLDTAIRNIVEGLGIAREQAEREVCAFAQELVKEGLIVSVAEPPAPPTFRLTASRYTPPLCEKFDDMADQLLLDKIDDQNKDAQWSQPQ